MIKQPRQGRRPTHPSIAEPKRTLSIDSTLRSGLQAHFSAGVFLFCLASRPDEAGREAAMGSRKSPRFHFTCRTHDPPPINLPVSLTAVSFAVKHKSDKPRTVAEAEREREGERARAKRGCKAGDKFFGT